MRRKNEEQDARQDYESSRGNVDGPGFGVLEPTAHAKDGISKKVLPISAHILSAGFWSNSRVWPRICSSVTESWGRGNGLEFLPALHVAIRCILSLIASPRQQETGPERPRRQGGSLPGILVASVQVHSQSFVLCRFPLLVQWTNTVGHAALGVVAVRTGVGRGAIESFGCGHFGSARRRGMLVSCVSARRSRLGLNTMSYDVSSDCCGAGFL